MSEVPTPMSCANVKAEAWIFVFRSVPSVRLLPSLCPKNFPECKYKIFGLTPRPPRFNKISVSQGIRRRRKSAVLIPTKNRPSGSENLQIPCGQLSVYRFHDFRFQDCPMSPNSEPRFLRANESPRPETGSHPERLADRIEFFTRVQQQFFHRLRGQTVVMHEITANGQHRHRRAD